LLTANFSAIFYKYLNTSQGLNNFLRKRKNCFKRKMDISGKKKDISENKKELSSKGRVPICTRGGFPPIISIIIKNYF